MRARISAEKWSERIARSSSLDQLQDTLSELTSSVGFRHYALIEHVEVSRGKTQPIRLHSYPELWANRFESDIGARDPIVTLSSRSCSAFSWNATSVQQRLDCGGRELISEARKAGVRDGVTVPANLAGRASGSCSFATPTRDVDLPSTLRDLQHLGTLLFEAAVHLNEADHLERVPRLTARQRECVLWVARGKSDWEIGQILGLSQLTVSEHMKKAQEAFEVSRRTALLSRALSLGDLTVEEIGF